MEALQFLVVPFLGSLLLVLIHAYFGIHILERGVIFLDLSLAQFVAVGIAFSFFLGDSHVFRTIWAVGFAILGASIFSFSRNIARYVNLEAFIGVLYVGSFAASILILDRTPHGMEEFKSILNGNILFLTRRDLLLSSLLYAAIGGLHAIFWKKFLNLTFKGQGGRGWEFLFFLSFAFLLASSVQIAGILQVFSYLIIPALIGRVLTNNFLGILLLGWLLALGASIFGLVLSFRWDLPTSPVIIASLSSAFFLVLIVVALRGRTQK
jgi:zinc/manganese transport system permease protein